MHVRKWERARQREYMYERFNNYSLTRPRLRKTVGWTLVIVGFVAVIAPIIPGAPVVFIGLELLGLRMILTDKVRRVFVRKERTTMLTPTSEQVF